MSTRPRASAIRGWADLPSVLIRSSDLQRAWIAASSQPDARRAATWAQGCRGAQGDATRPGTRLARRGRAVRASRSGPTALHRPARGHLQRGPHGRRLVPAAHQMVRLAVHPPRAAGLRHGHGRVDVLRRARHQRARPRPRASPGRARRPPETQPTPLRPEPHPVVLRRAVLHRRRRDHRLLQQRLATDPGQHHRHRHRPVRRAGRSPGGSASSGPTTLATCASDGSTATSGPT